MPLAQQPGLWSKPQVQKDDERGTQRPQYPGERIISRKMSDRRSLADIFERVPKLFWKFAWKGSSYYSPLDSWALFFHYKLSFMLFAGIYMALVKGYFEDELIRCWSHAGALLELSDPAKLAVCLQYAHIDLDDKEDTGSVLAYTWHPYVFVIICVLMYIPHLMKNTVANERLERFISSLSGLSKTDVPLKIRQYCYDNVGSHDGILVASLQISLTCLLCDLAAFSLLDIAAMHKFYNIIFHYPYIRDMTNYQREFSRVFPSSTKCAITPTMQLALLGTESYGCTLPLNWYYEKIYIILFVCFIVLTVLSISSILIDLWSLLPMHRYSWVPMDPQYLLWTKKVAKFWSSDELYILKHFRKSVGVKGFVDIMETVLSVQENIIDISPEKERTLREQVLTKRVD